VITQPTPVTPQPPPATTLLLPVTPQLPPVTTRLPPVTTRLPPVKTRLSPVTTRLPPVTAALSPVEEGRSGFEHCCHAAMTGRIDPEWRRFKSERRFSGSVAFRPGIASIRVEFAIDAPRSRHRLCRR